MYRILAVIPARAGSKGIPNKNIRIIAGHPLIYYAIKNAKESKFITDIIVTTDSPEIKIIAEQMGVRCHWRDVKLCGDSVTLDSVIFDAIPKDVDWDYVVTMQPTSPNLTVGTLDSGIQYTIEGRYDTVISAINRPHLTWGIKDGRYVPNYIERLNRQYLPPNYCETGAFVISKADIITESSRFGTNISLYEIPEEESNDIDSFSDLNNAAMALNRPKVAIYVNGNNKRGMGHIYRALELADEFYVKPDLIYDKNQTDPSIFGKTTHNIVPVDGLMELFKRAKREQYTLFINDILSTTIDYMIGLRSVLPGAKIVNFEDDGEGVMKANLVFNALFHDSPLLHVKSGEKYYIAAKTFMFYEPININENVKNVFISFGGADPQNYSDRLLKIVTKEEYINYHFTFVLGRAKNNVNELLSYNKYSNIDVLYDVHNMPELMSKSDIAITSRGRTGYELAILGIPCIAIAQNEREERHGFISNENGFTYIGLNPTDEIIEGTLKMYLGLSYESRLKFHNKLLSFDLRGGRSRVMSLINNL